MPPPPALLVDLYELTMGESYVREGITLFFPNEPVLEVTAPLVEASSSRPSSSITFTSSR